MGKDRVEMGASAGEEEDVHSAKEGQRNHGIEVLRLGTNGGGCKRLEEEEREEGEGVNTWVSVVRGRERRRGRRGGLGHGRLREREKMGQKREFGPRGKKGFLIHF